MGFHRFILLSSVLELLVASLLFSSISATNNIASNNKIEVTVRFTYIHFEDVVDSGKNDYPDIQFKVTIEGNSKDTDKLENVKNGSIEPVLHTSLLVKDVTNLDIKIKCIERDTGRIIPEKVDIDPVNDNNKVLEIRYDRRDGTLSGEDDDFKVNGSRDGTTGTDGENDQNDATLTYEIDAPSYSKREVGFWEKVTVIVFIIVVVGIPFGFLYMLRKR